MSTQTEQIDWGHWIYRLIALIIDSVITGIVGAIIYWILLIPAIISGAVFGIVPWWGASILLPFIYGIILVLYSAFLEASWNGMTVGKKLLGLQVQTNNGGKVTFDKAFLRNITKIYWLLLLLDWLLGIFSTGNRRQKYTDRMAGTVVVQTKQPYGTAPLPPPPPPPS